jgi:RND superfamily putative drug exporter
MAGTGGVVTAAGLVFAFTMASMVGSDMRAIGQFGSTVCVGLLLDTLIVRTLFMPSIATLLGRWFWWPQVVHRRGAPQPAASSPARGPKQRRPLSRLGRVR